MSVRTLILVRHCASEGQQPEAELTAEGRGAAGKLADQLSAFDFDAIYSSPYRRAVATIEPLARMRGIPITSDVRLAERVLAERDRADWREHLERSFREDDYCLEGGESMRTARDRGLGALGEVAARHRLPIAVSHGGLIAAVLRSVGEPFGFDDWKSLRNPESFELSFSGASLVGWRRLDLRL